MKATFILIICGSLFFFISCVNPTDQGIEDDNASVDDDPNTTQLDKNLSFGSNEGDRHFRSTGNGDGLAATLINDLRTNLNQLGTIESEPKVDLVSSILILTDMQLDIIVNSAIQTIYDNDLVDSINFQALITVIIQGVESSLIGLNLKDADSTILLLGGVLGSLEKSIKGNQQYLGIDLDDGNKNAAIISLLNTMADTAIHYLDRTGLTQKEIIEGSKYVVKAMVANLDEIGIEKSTLYEAVGSVTSGAINGIDKLIAKDFATISIEEMIQKVTAGATAALDEIELEGYSSEDFSTMIEGITEGALAGIHNLSRDTQNTEELMKSVLAGILESQPTLGTGDSPFAITTSPTLSPLPVVSTTNTVKSVDIQAYIIPICGAVGDGCYDNADAVAAGEAQTPLGKLLVHVDNGTGFFVWKEKDGNKILKADGLDRWQTKLNADGKSFSDATFEDSATLKGRACPDRVYLNDSTKFASNNCLYYDSGDSFLRPHISGVDGVLGLGSWADMGGEKWYRGNMKQCGDKGMRLPTLYETQGYTGDATYYPNDGDPQVLDRLKGIPSPSQTWTLSASSNTYSPDT